MPVPATEPNGSPDTWHPYEFPADDPRGGVLTQISFVALHSPPGRSSPTLRGKGLREIMLCEKVPPPPGDVKFNLINDTSNPLYKTARQRLTAHRTAPTCAGCHKLMDPIGLALENFDGEGAHRTSENGAPIDGSGELDNVTFKDSAGLGRAIHDNPAATACLVSRISSYGLGRMPAKSELVWVKDLETGFAAQGYRLRDLMARIATSAEFYEASPARRWCIDRAGADKSGSRWIIGDWKMTREFTRRTVLRGAFNGAAVCVALPFLDCFLDDNGAALAATGTPLPVVFRYVVPAAGLQSWPLDARYGGSQLCE